MKWHIFILIIIPITFYDQQLIDTSNVEDEFALYEKDKLSASFFFERRKAFRALMPDNSVAFLFSNPVRNRSNDVNYEYHQDPNIYYLSGYEEPHSLLVIFKDTIELKGEVTNEILFVQPRDESKEIWDGKRLGVKGVEKLLQIKKAIRTEDFKEIDFHIEDFGSIHVIKPSNDVKDNIYNNEDLFSLILQFNAKLLLAKESTVDDSEIKKWLNQLREIKTKEELALMRKAIDITCKALIEHMKSLRPGMKEYESEAIIEYIFKKSGAEYPGFPSILGSGQNSCILHYVTNRRTMNENNLIVSDVGAEYHGYTADVTRTLPVDGIFSEEEAIIYNIVLEAQEAGIKECKAGNRFWDPNIAATTVISQRLKELGIIQKPLDIRNYFMHGTSHYLGLDVHDKGTYGPLQPNSVITVEPGIYIAEGSLCDPKWWNIGVRIEDDVLITSGEPEILSDCVPKTIEQIESLMTKDSYLSE